MSRTRSNGIVDTTAGTQAYTLAARYHAVIDPRLPVGTVGNLVADLTTLGASPSLPSAEPPPSQPPPSLPEAMATAVTLISAVHEALRGPQVKSSVRKLYGVSNKMPSEEASAVIASGEKIVTQAHESPTEALSLGILPSDVKALVEALADLAAADALAKGRSGQVGSTGKERRAAEVRMRHAVARISGAGVMAFATNAAVRAEFAALKQTKSG